VAHSTAGFAGPRLDDPAAAGPGLERAVRELLALPAPADTVHVHRWTFAQPRPAGDGAPFHEADGVLLAGDAFGRPRVQTAWLSGRAAGRALAQRLAGSPQTGSTER
jgi:renalase